MDAVFSLPWPELVVAERLQKHFPKTQGYSVYIPAGRQEKAVDLALVKRRAAGASKIATLQVKASRTYLGEPPKRASTAARFRFYTWFNRFDPPDDADFFLLIGFYTQDPAATSGASPSWYRDIILLLTNTEMKTLIKNCNTVKGKPDGKFGFGFDSEDKITQTRGERGRDLSHALLSKRTNLLEQHLK